MICKKSQASAPGKMHKFPLGECSDVDVIPLANASEQKAIRSKHRRRVAGVFAALALAFTAPAHAQTLQNFVQNGDLAGTAGWEESHNTGSTSGSYTVRLTGTNSPLSGGPFGSSGATNADGVSQSFVDNDGDLLGAAPLNVRALQSIDVVNGAQYQFAFDIVEVDNAADRSARLTWVLISPSTGAVQQIIPNSTVETDNGVDQSSAAGVGTITTTWQTFDSGTFAATVPTGTYQLGMLYDVYSDPAVPVSVAIDFQIDRVFFGTNVGMSLDKSVDTSGLSLPIAVGDTLTYTFQAQNTGNVSLANVTPVDTMNLGATGTGAAVSLTTGPTLVPSSDPNANGLLDPGETFEYTATFDLMMDAINAGGLYNSATSTANPVDSTGADITAMPDVVATSNNVALNYANLPMAADDTANSTTVIAVTVDPLANDVDPNGSLDATTVVLTTAGAPTGATLASDGKTLTVPNEGVWTVANSGQITFTPDSALVGNPTPASYTVNDNSGNTSNAATVTITYGVAPVATNDTIAATTSQPATIDPLVNDTDADGTLDATTVVLTTAGAPTGATLASDGKTLTVPNEGVWTVANSGQITFTPDSALVGDPTPASYTVNDDAGNTSNAATVTVTYGAGPVASDDTVASAGTGPIAFSPLTNDTGPSALDPTRVVLTATGAPSGSTLASDGKSLTVPGQGTWSVDPTTGATTFTPETTFTGVPTAASYTVTDINGRTSNEARLIVTAAAPGLPLTANDDGPLTFDGPMGGTSTVSVISNDAFGTTLITDATLIALTTVTAPSPAAGSVTLNSDGTVTVAPGTTAGSYTLTYQICEAVDPTNCATADVEVVVFNSGTGLIAEIEEDLVSILEEDLANTLTSQSRQIGTYSADALGRLQGRSHNTCLADVNARLSSENILFDTDRAVIKPESNGTLDAIARILASCQGSAFEIAGHTDSDASDAYNIDLSQRRAAAVRRALSARNVDTSGFIARGYGEREPIASNDTDEGKLINRRVEFRPIDATASYEGPCESEFNLFRAFDAKANGNGVTADGRFQRDDHNCVTDRREIFEGSLSYSDTGTGQTQNAINLSYRREQYRGSDSVFGYFVGLYSSKSDVTQLADGDVRGLGVNAGIYGANRLKNELFFDYYLGGATGRHDFDLAFDRAIGTVAASGDYRYMAGFAGAALSGEVNVGQTKLKPRAGLDYVYTPGADVDVVAEMGALSQAGALELSAISGGRAFLEVRGDRLIRQGQANVWVNPRIACYQSLGALDGVCGFGGSLGIESASENSALTYAVELDGEWGEDYSLGSVTMSVERAIGLGVLSGDAGLNSNGATSIGGNFEVKF
ncbi:MAG: OmpA family protein [Paracoccaceae bacterium]